MISPRPFAVAGRRILAPEGFREGAVLVENGKVKSVAPRAAVPKDWPVDEAGDAAVLPGLVDTHVHVNEPGRTEWEGFETATKAAAAGGVTTILDMPLNSIPVTTTAAALEIKRQAARAQLHVDCGFLGGVVPGNLKELPALADAGAFGFKAFMIASGIDEFPEAAEADLRAAMPVLAERGLPLMVHAEVDCCPGAAPKNPRAYAGYLASRPRRWENEAIDLIIKLSRDTGCAVHIVHLSSSDALASIAEAKKEKIPLTAETCPHYLCFSSEEIADGRTEFKCAPPIRENANREALWKGLAEGTIDFVVSDHSPCTPELKRADTGDFSAAWGGISSLQFTLPAMWTEGSRRGHSLDEISRWMSKRTAEFAGLPRKGALAPGRDADIVVFDPEGETAVTPAGMAFRNKVSPYSGRSLRGSVRRTYLGGRKIYDNGRWEPALSGRALSREP